MKKNFLFALALIVMSVATAFSQEMLSGLVISYAGGYIGGDGGDGPNYKPENAFDGVEETTFAAGQKAPNWVGLRFLTPKKIDRIRFYPRQGNLYCIPYGVFQGANKADFSDAVALSAPLTAPAAGVWTEIQSLDKTTNFTYARWFVPENNGSPDGNADMNEIEFYGTEGTTGSTLTKVTGTFTGTPGWGDPGQFDVAYAFDDDYTTEYASKDAGTDAHLDFDLGASAPKVNYIYVTTRSAGPGKPAIEGATLKGSDNADFSNAVAIYQIQSSIILGSGNLIAITPDKAYRYLRLEAPVGQGIIVREFALYTESAKASSQEQLFGLVISTGGYIGGDGSDGPNYKPENAFDGVEGTTFAAGNDAPNYVGLRFLTPKKIDHIRLYPRQPNRYCIPFGVVEGANKADFSDAVRLSDPLTEPAPETWVEIQSLDKTSSFKYVRYFVPANQNPNGPASNSDLNELEFYGSEGDGSSTLTKLTGTFSGSVGWGDPGQFDAAYAYDDDYSTEFASKADDGTGYLSADLGEGAPKMSHIYITTRSAGPGKPAIEGATLMGSDNADFSDAVAIYQIQSSIILGTGNLLAVNPDKAYRYIRLVAPAGNMLIVREFALYGGDGTTGLFNLNGKNTELKIWPNPASDNATISFNSDTNAVVTINIHDLQGRLVRSENVLTLNGTKFSHTLIISDLAKGTYLLRINAGSNIAVGKLIKN